MMTGTTSGHGAESQSLPNGAESDTQFDEAAAWEAFFEWQFDQAGVLAIMAARERFDATNAKLRELGLPEAIPWARVREP